MSPGTTHRSAHAPAWALVAALAVGGTLPARAALDCSMPEGTIDFATGNLQELSGSTAGRTNLAELYSCGPALFDGPEAVWEVLLPVPGQVAIQLVSGEPGLSAFLVSACDEGSCVALARPGRSGCAAGLPAGTYYLVIDGEAASEGDYEARLVRDDDVQRWDACQTAVPPTMASDTLSTRWHFDDGATCVTDPRSRNFPGGCAFSMYLNVDCGDSLELVLADVEAGHLSVTEVTSGELVDLEAGSASWLMSGTDLQWSDADCPGASPDPPGDDVAVRLGSAEGLCGIFRLDFAADHAGSVWALLANCDASLAPAFEIGDSLCAALDAYRPLPQLEFGAVTETDDCPDVAIGYEIVNLGCAPAREVEVRLRDGARIIASELVPEVGVGGTAGGSFDLPLPFPTDNLLLEIDPDDVTPECGEVPGVSCSVGSGVRVVPLVGCPDPCAVDARATVSPSSWCEDAPPAELVIDASASLFGDCPSGLEYLLFDGVDTTPPQLSPVFRIPPPAADTPYAVIARCIDNPSCQDGTGVPVSVHLRPVFAPASFTATDLSECAPGISLDWAPATFRGPGRTGTYNLYRGTTDCEMGLDLIRLGLSDADRPYLDLPPGSGPYFYVLEAEDDRDGSLCDPSPGRGGSTARLAADDGGCDEILDRSDCAELDCADGLDDDGDLLVDCEDADCDCALGDCPASDCDGDGVANGSDCAPEDSPSFALPGGVELRVAVAAGDEIELSWTSLAPIAGLGTAYDLATEPLADLLAAGAATAPCLLTGQAAPLFLDGRSTPDSYYLVRAWNACGPPPGSGWGSDSAGDPRPACP